jgi:molecular chaperone GrpE
MGKKQEELADEPQIEIVNSREAELLTDLQRTRADFENYRRNVLAAEERSVFSAEKKLIVKLLPLIDDISRAVVAIPDKADTSFDKWAEGFAKLPAGLDKALGAIGVQKISSGVGEVFDPETQEAVAFDEDGEGEEKIAEELQSGYQYKNQVIRPAMVKVKRG